MSVIVELTLPSDAFELGQILRVEGRARVSLETMVPMGDHPTPFVRVQNVDRGRFEERVRAHSMVRDVHVATRHDGETLYALDWNPTSDTLFRGLLNIDVAVLGATGGADRWELELRFPSHDALSEFQTYYTDHDIEVTVERIYNPTRPEAGAWYGLTPPQREALSLAVRSGYYSLPRRVSTQDLATEAGISDQAVIERLRRGITALVENTLLTAEEER